jgi:hypothetical protein
MRILKSAVVAIVCTGAASATYATAQSNDAAKPVGTAGRPTITVNGCLQRAEEASTPATGNAGALRVEGESFVLINAVATGTGTQPADVTTYVVQGASGFASMVGKRVEVTGTVSPAAVSDTRSTTSAENHEAGGPAGDAGAAKPSSVVPSAPAQSKSPRIQVTSLREVEGDCSSNAATRPE